MRCANGFLPPSEKRGEEVDAAEKERPRALSALLEVAVEFTLRTPPEKNIYCLNPLLTERVFIIGLFSNQFVIPREEALGNLEYAIRHKGRGKHVY